ncbi:MULTISPECIES: TlpA disulfide reductase family protein [unclassified Ruegeria]|uniref:TlpA disulfide reductase family protein n=1 Tax=unclassified Ruegeria TaxID=2625375 RepID=UPI001489BA29|nr:MULTISPECIES: TlpA disulfide reductase family protein [unclassified Ruegeria]NOD34948.1 redoxin domain-containing protein [Ruegeria sp. HKCCD7296]NOD47972.1 redoxin domain-containing protein [Ruegeria sp. HKCCD5849]NOD52956.1 redoxin domain-containing protein [Ruegeria sp. HKCCD5851]NOD69102.1 redoxin domain-containing protein [Ruegeria sp. HKCCD7303]NOE35192.1 redoxin domain-containing protein [Ruegeria sp. HKCCD7318]
MRLFRLIPLYMALALGANAALATDAETLAPLREDSLKRLILHKEPKPAKSIEFQLEDEGGVGTLADYEGKYVLLNFWATWCAPCRKEMPQIAELQEEFGGDKFQVLTLATGRNSPAGIEKFFEENGIANLPRHQDPSSAAAREFGVIALPITVILDPEGQEIARLIGDAEWNSDSAKTIISTLVEANS